MSLIDETGGVTEELFAGLLHQIFAAIMSTGEEDVFVQRDHDIYDTVAANIPQQGQMVASIDIHGDHTGLVTAVAGPATAANLALLMHGEHEADLEDCEDALGEVVNIIAGNAKGLLQGENHLGLPEVEMHRAVPRADEDVETWSWQIALPVGMISIHLSILPTTS